jgi:hypothetical protein
MREGPSKSAVRCRLQTTASSRLRAGAGTKIGETVKKPRLRLAKIHAPVAPSSQLRDRDARAALAAILPFRLRPLAPTSALPPRAGRHPRASTYTVLGPWLVTANELTDRRPLTGPSRCFWTVFGPPLRAKATNLLQFRTSQLWPLSDVLRLCKPCLLGQRSRGGFHGSQTAYFQCEKTQRRIQEGP